MLWADQAHTLSYTMNELAEDLVRTATRRFQGGQFVVEPNVADAEADPGSVVLRFSHPRRRERQLRIVQRGNALEVTYSDGSPPGPAESLFVFRDDIERRAAIEAALEFVGGFFSGAIVAYRERLGRASRWLRRDNQPSFLRFGSTQDLARLPPGSIEAVYDWRID